MKTENPGKENRGGKRKGASPPTLPKGEHKKMVEVYIEQDFIDELGGKKKLKGEIREFVYGLRERKNLIAGIKQKLINEQINKDSETAHGNAVDYLLELLDELNLSEITKEYRLIDHGWQ